MAALDETGEILQEAMKMANIAVREEPSQEAPGNLLQIPSARAANGARRAASVEDDGTESDRRSGSDAGSVASTISPSDG